MDNREAFTQNTVGGQMELRSDFHQVREIMDGPARIYCFCNVGVPGWYEGYAIREDGKTLARHTSSTEEWMPYNLGIGSRINHGHYGAQCPGGFELVWVHDPANHEALQRVYKLNREQAIV